MSDKKPTVMTFDCVRYEASEWLDPSGVLALTQPHIISGGPVTLKQCFDPSPFTDGEAVPSST